LNVRVSLGTLMALGAEKGKANAPVGIAYIMQYSNSGCSSFCTFCSQSSISSSNKGFLSRVLWPVRDALKIAESLQSSYIKRVCIQTVIKENFISEAHELARLFSATGKGISLSITPVPLKDLERFKEEGVDYIGVGLDACSERILKRTLKPYSWSLYWSFIKEAVSLFGKGKVVTHLIIGLGETYGELIQTLQKLHEVGSEISLFAFTPVKGTPMENESPPSKRIYRFAQLLTYLITQGYDWRDVVVFKKGKPYIKRKYIMPFNSIEKAFMTRGCPGCNRPFYNESPNEEPFNFPSREHLIKWQEKLRNEVEMLLVD